VAVLLWFGSAAFIREDCKMTLVEKIKAIYPELTDSDFEYNKIYLRNDSDGKGDYIAKWEHPTYPQPTQAQLDAVTE
jgi:hypothetical protein